MACGASRKRDGHSSRTPVARRIKQPTRTADPDRSGIAPAPFLFGLAPGGVCRAASVAGNAVRSYRTVSPLPRLNATRRGGLFSVALSLGRSRRAIPPDVIRHRLSMEPGLSSPAAFRHWRGAAVRPTDGIGMVAGGALASRPCCATALKGLKRPLSQLTSGRPRFDQRAQRQQRGGVGDAVDASLPEMALECRHHLARRIVIGRSFPPAHSHRSATYAASRVTASPRSPGLSPMPSRSSGAARTQ